ncbi:restriction endonuclease subunit S [Kingella kingae]|nr:restriction endonuclease subunit S [Kingella kingae]
MGSVANSRATRRRFGKVESRLQEMENAFLASGGEFVQKKVGDIFQIETGSLVGTEKLTNGEIRRISAKNENNGIIGSFNTLNVEEARHFENFITVNFFGKAFYHPYQASVEMKVHVLKMKNHIFNKYTGLYLTALLDKRFSENYSYGSQLSSSKLKQHDFYIELPYQNNEIAFDYMECFVQQLRAFLKLSNLTDVNLSKDEENALAQLSDSLNWKEFRLDDLFNIATGRDVIIGNTISGSIPLISHQHENNGISKYIHPLPDRRLFNHETTLSLADRGVFKASTQNQHFHIGTRVKALTFKNGKHSQNVRLFVVAAINKLQILFTAYSENATNKLPDLMIMLPEKDGTPDWEFMALIGRAIEKCVIADVVAFNEREMAAYEQVI